MRLKFWGVRGSIPTPLTASALKTRISAALQRLTPGDLRSPERLEAFMHRLPKYVFQTVGGNTTCIELDREGNEGIIIDAGTGIRELASYEAQENRQRKKYHIFLTHFHWDHIQGIPFFTPLFKPDVEVILYSPVKGFGKFIQDQMSAPYFPVEWKDLRSKNHFVELTGEEADIGDVRVKWKKMKHPGDSFAYKFNTGGKNLVIATDSEIEEADFQRTDENFRFFKNSDLMIMDSQYTLEESITKVDWGHSSYSLAVDFASEWRTKQLVLFHHEPMYNDKKLFNIEKSANWYLEHLEFNDMKVMIAMEGMEILL